MSQMSVEMSAEMAPAPEPKQKQKRSKRDPSNPKQPGKRGQPRPYRKLSDDLLTMRVTKLTSRLERVKKQVWRRVHPIIIILIIIMVVVNEADPSFFLQHEDTKRLLTKYSYEKTFRLRDTLAAVPNDLAGLGETVDAAVPACS
jgi:hypothetical protein